MNQKQVAKYLSKIATRLPPEWFIAYKKSYEYDDDLQARLTQQGIELNGVNQLMGPQISFYSNPTGDVNQFVADMTAAQGVLQRQISSGQTMPQILVDAMMQQCQDGTNAPDTHWNPPSSIPSSFSFSTYRVDANSNANMKTPQQIQLIKTTYNQMYVFLKDTYYSHARAQIGLWGIKQNDDIYTTYLGSYLGTFAYSVEQLHNLGLEATKTIKREIIDVAAKAGLLNAATNSTTMSQAFSRIFRRTDQKKADDDQKAFDQIKQMLLKDAYPNKQALMQDLYATLQQLYTTLPHYFFKRDLPRVHDLDVDKINNQYSPLFYYSDQEAHQPNLYVNFYSTDNTFPANKWTLPSLLQHEVAPGHYFERIHGNKDKTVSANALNKHDLFWHRYGVMKSITVIEGWGLFSEGLLPFRDVYAHLGMLMLRLMRTVRLVVDTGIHGNAHRWSFERAHKYLYENTSFTSDQAKTEVYRYVSIPGQACCYYVGYLHIKKWQKQFLNFYLNNPGKYRNIYYENGKEKEKHSKKRDESSSTAVSFPIFTPPFPSSSASSSLTLFTAASRDVDVIYPTIQDKMRQRGIKEFHSLIFNNELPLVGMDTLFTCLSSF